MKNPLSRYAWIPVATMSLLAAADCAIKTPKDPFTISEFQHELQKHDDELQT